MILLKKALRSMWGSKKSYIACIVLILTGMTMYVSMGTSATALDNAKIVYYKNNRLADVFAEVTAIPHSACEALENIEGVAQVLPRQTYDARVLLDNDKIITLRLISVDLDIEAPLNEMVLIGENFANSNDIAIGEGFLKNYNLGFGDTIKLLVEGREIDFNIIASAMSPDYVYAIKDATEFIPDPTSFDIAFVEQDQLFTITKSSFYNNINLKLEDGYKFSDLKTELEDSLSKYGLLSLVERKDQISYSMLQTEIESNRSMATAIPGVFLFMAIIVLYIMMKRIIEQDRGQIGTLKAFGYSNSTIVFHYMFYGALTGLIGGILGVYFGYLASDYFIALFADFYRLPNVTKTSVVSYIINGILISLLSGAIGSFMGARGVIKLTPSEAMRAKPPKPVTKDSIKDIFIFKLILSSKGFMAIRSILRNKFRSVFVVIGIMFSYGMLTFTSSYSEMFDDLLFSQFTKIQIYDGKITYINPVNLQKAEEEVQKIDSITLSEGLLEIPVEMTNKHKKTGMTITGIKENSSLYKIHDSELKKNFNAPKNGIIITNALAKTLEANVGDKIKISSQLLSEDKYIPVIRIVTQNLGSGCYIEQKALAEFFDINETATSVIFNTSDMDYIKTLSNQGNNIKSIVDKKQALRMYEGFLASYGSMITALNFISMIIAFAIIYNTASISLSERKREYATLRVLGMYVEEVSEIINFEYWILCFFGILAGIPFAILLKKSIAELVSIDMFTISENNPMESYIIAALGCIIAVFVSNLSSKKNIRGFDMVEVLKERE